MASAIPVILELQACRHDLEDLLKHRLLSLVPGVFGSLGLGWGPRCIYKFSDDVDAGSSETGF